MRQAVIMSNYDTNSVYRVYTNDILKQLSQHVNLFETVIHHKNINQHEDILKNTEVIFSTWGMPQFTDEEIDRLFPKLEIIFYSAGSVKSFAENFIKKGIRVISAWQANAIPTAEYAACEIVLANKGFFQAQIAVKTKGYWDAMHFTNQFPGNYQVKIGILGAGMVGKHVIKLLKAMHIHCELYVFDPFLSDEQASELGVYKVDLKTIFSTCLTISNHLANNEQTQNMITYEHFDLMQPYATFINTGRGQQVVECDLIRALKEVPTRTAVLDVTSPEPPVHGSELYSLDNVILTPHSAGSKGNEVERMAQYMVDELIRWTKLEQLRYEVTLGMLKTMA